MTTDKENENSMTVQILLQEILLATTQDDDIEHSRRPGATGQDRASREPREFSTSVGAKFQQWRRFFS